MRFADSQDAVHLNTLLVTTYPDSYPAQLTAAYFTRLGPHAEVVPELVRALPTQANGGISADGKTMLFELRPGLRWSDGKPLTAADAVFTAGLIKAKNTPVVGATGWDRVTSVDSPRPGEVRFRLKEPYGSAAGTFFNSFNVISILPEHLLKSTTDLRTAPFNALPVGAGPFRYTEFKRGDRLVMDANPYYFRGHPKLDRIVYEFVPDENTVATDVITGEIEIAIRMPPTQLARLLAARDLTVVRTPSGNSGYIGFNVTKPPLDDPRVREALRLALDRKVIQAKIYHGTGSVSDDVVTPLDPFLGTPVETQPTDLKRASELLDSAGWHTDATGARTRDGRPLTIDFIVLAQNRVGASVAEMVRSQWARIGAAMSIRTINGDVVFGAGGNAARGDFGGMLFGSALTSDSLSTTFTCASRPPIGFNYQRWCNRETDALLSRGDASYNAAERTTLYGKARAQIAAASFFIPTVHREDDHFLRPGVTGFRPNGLTLFDDVMDLDVTSKSR